MISDPLDHLLLWVKSDPREWWGLPSLLAPQVKTDPQGEWGNLPPDQQLLQVKPDPQDLCHILALLVKIDPRALGGFQEKTDP